MSEDWPDPLPDTIPGEGVVREVELLQVPKDRLMTYLIPYQVKVLSEIRSSSRCLKIGLIPYLIPYQVKVLSER